MNEGELWSWVRSVMGQGSDIRVDYDMGKYKAYEAYSARLDAAAAERAQELAARNGWRPIEEDAAMPPCDVAVLLYCPFRCETNEERFEVGVYRDTRCGSVHAWATHWMPLPSPPQGDAA